MNVKKGFYDSCDENEEAAFDAAIRHLKNHPELLI
jgi:hypothetical protein